MAVQSTIEWTEATWNPLIGCTSVSPGCDNCYARTQVNTRFHPAALANGGKHLEAFPTPFDTVSIRPDRFLTQPLHWATPKRIFVNSLSDLFHQDVPDEFIAKVFAVMALAQRHTFQLLTKRHGRMHSLLSSVAFTDLMLDAAGDLAGQQPVVAWPLPNVWLGVSVENQQWADIRIPMLLNTPAAIRWLSCEPLLGPLTLSTATRAQIDWVVAGGESGPGARPMHPDWARSLRDECTAADVAFFFKQWGNWAPFPVYQGAEKNTFVMNATTGEGTYYSQRNQPGNAEMWNVGKKAAGRELDGRTWSEMPAAVPV